MENINNTIRIYERDIQESLGFPKLITSKGFFWSSLNVEGAGDLKYILPFKGGDWAYFSWIKGKYNDWW